MASKPKSGNGSAPQKVQDPESPTKRITRSRGSEGKVEPKDKLSPAVERTSPKRVTRSKDVADKEPPKDKLPPAGVRTSPGSAAKAVTQSKEIDANDEPKSSPAASSTSGRATTLGSQSKDKEDKDASKEKSLISEESSPAIDSASSGTATKLVTQSKVVGTKGDVNDKSAPSDTGVDDVTADQEAKQTSRPPENKATEKKSPPSGKEASPQVNSVTKGITRPKGSESKAVPGDKSSSTKVKPSDHDYVSKIDQCKGEKGNQTNTGPVVLLKLKSIDKDDEVNAEKIDSFLKKLKSNLFKEKNKLGGEENEEDPKTGGSTSPSAEEQILECRFCSEFFILSSLKLHIEKTHTHVETEICPKCGYCEITGGPMKKHPSCFACWTCSTFFNSKSSLKEHMILHDIPGEDDDWHTCDSCQARFFSRKAFEAHLKCHVIDEDATEVIMSGENANSMSDDDSSDDNDIPIKQCRGCSKFFKSMKSLVRHVKRKHTKVKTGVCDECGFFQKVGGPVGKHFCGTEKERRKEAKSRIRKKIKAKPPGERYACKLCSKTYAFHQGLRAHMNTHKPASEKPYRCEVCHKAFAKKILFQDHMRIHTGEKPFMCHICAKFFRSGANLRQHHRRCKKKDHSYPSPHSVTTKRVTTDLYGMQMVEEVIEPVIYEVQMEILDGQGETVVIDLSSMDQGYIQAQKRMKSTVLNESTGVMYEQEVESREVDMETKESMEASVDIKGTAQDEAIRPVPTNESQHREEAVKTEKADEVDDEKLGEMDATEDNTPEPMDDSADSNPPPADHEDHDYIRETHSVLEEQQVQENVQPKLLAIYFMCPHCKLLLDSKLSVKRHIKSKHKKAKEFDGIVVLGHPGKEGKNKRGGEDTLPVDWAYQCSHCNAFFSEAEICGHLESIEIKSGVCKVCLRVHKEGAKSVTKCKLSRARKAFQCPYCSIKPAALCDLRSHLPMQHGKNEYPCTICDESFPNKRGLSCHLKRHARENEPKGQKKKKKYICEKCSKVVTDAASFRIHLLHHDNPKPFACKLCDKAYTFPNGLRVHMRGHTKNFPFLCEYCSRTFKTKACLICHVRCHTGEKPFECDLCGKEFRTKANLRQHLKRCNVPVPTSIIQNTSVEAETAELQIATEIVTEQPESYLLLVQKPGDDGEEEYTAVEVIS